MQRTILFIFIIFLIYSCEKSNEVNFEQLLNNSKWQKFSYVNIGYDKNDKILDRYYKKIPESDADQMQLLANGVAYIKYHYNENRIKGEWQLIDDTIIVWYNTVDRLGNFIFIEGRIIKIDKSELIIEIENHTITGNIRKRIIQTRLVLTR